MLTAEDLKVVLASAPLREAHRLELPQGSLNTLATDPGAFATFYDQWTAQGQPPYVPPTPAAAATPPVPVAPSPYGPPPTPPTAQQFSPYSRDPSSTVAAFAGATPPPPYASQYSPSQYSGANDLNSPNAVAPAGLSRPGMTMMLWGFGVAIVGVIVTAVTWAIAAPGGTFVVAWGAILFGSIRGIIGLARVVRGG